MWAANACYCCDTPTGGIVTLQSSLCQWPTNRCDCHCPHPLANAPRAGVAVSCQWPTSRCGWHLPMTHQQVWLALANDPPAGVVGTCQWPTSRCGWHPSHKSQSCQRPTSRRHCHCPMFLPMTHIRCGCDCPHIPANDPQQVWLRLSSHSCQWPTVGVVVTVLTFLPMTHSRCGYDCPHIPVSDPPAGVAVTVTTLLPMTDSDSGTKHASDRTFIDFNNLAFPSVPSQLL